MNLIFKIHLTLIIIFYCNVIPAQPFLPGQTYYDPTGYVEYRAGNMPVIISAPHGGSLKPIAIPDRDCTGCSYIQDAWTKPISEGVYDVFFEETGCYPHVIINLLHRIKFDANRDIDDAADGNPTVEEAWYGYHGFIDAAKAQIVQDYGRGLFLDIHGHSHTLQKIELGYLLSDAELRLSDATLNTNTYIEESSIRTLVGDNIQNLTHAELLRGADSFGTLLHDKDFPSVPSFTDPFPQVGDDYFNGGYNTQRHGSRDNAGNIDAIQLELNQDIRFDAPTRLKLIDSLTIATIQYINFHYNDQFIGNYCSLLLPVELLAFEATKKGDKAVLNWATLTESNNDYFEIERRSDDGIFTKIGKVNGQGNSSDLLEYSYIDKRPKNGINYYRLKQIDKDGKFAFSHIVSVEFNQLDQQNIVFYPNPSPSGHVALTYFSPHEDVFTVSVYDVSGKVMLHQIKPISSGKNLLSFDFSSLNEGMYIVRIGTESWHTFQKVVVE